MVWTTPATPTLGQFVTSTYWDPQVRDNFNYLKTQDDVVKYAQATANSSSTSGTTILDVLTAPAFTPVTATRLIKITVHWRSINVATDPGIYLVMIREGSTKLNEQSHKVETVGTGQQGGTMVHYVASPTAAAHTYKLSIQRATGTGTAVVEADPTYPCQIIVQDAGAA